MVVDSDSDYSWYQPPLQGAWSGWLKELAPRKIQSIFVTLDTFQSLSGWLKDSAPPNINSRVILVDRDDRLDGPVRDT